MHNPPHVGNRADTIKDLIAQLGGTAEVAKVCGVMRTQVWRWTAEKNRSAGLGGKIPQRHWRSIRAHAASMGIDVPSSLLAPELAE